LKEIRKGISDVGRILHTKTRNFQKEKVVEGGASPEDSGGKHDQAIDDE